MKVKVLFFSYLCAVAGLVSCAENLNEDAVVNSKEIPEEAVVPDQVASTYRFAEILSAAVNENPDLRVFLKNKAVEMVDRDYDVFYPLAKNEIIAEGKSFRDILSEYATGEEELMQIEETLPLLTIYVPELPSGFDAEQWDAQEEIPCVATNITENGKVNFYQNGKVVFGIESYEIPGFPTLVIKNNERIRLKNKVTDKNIASLRSTSGNDLYEFIDDAFNGELARPELRSSVKPSNELAPELLPAYNMMGATGTYWQRDNIYYGLTKTPGTTGPLNRRMMEKIVSIKFSSQAYYKMADQTGDPQATKEVRELTVNPAVRIYPSYSIGDLLWTDGRFEIKIDILVSNLSGLGTTLTKYFNVSPRDVFKVQYTQRQSLGSLYSSMFKTYVPTGVTGGKEYNPNINLITWDLQSNGIAWKYIISEVDDQETYSTTESMTSEYATNFSVSANFDVAVVKVGLNYGTSAKKTVNNTYTRTITKNSDELGTLESHFSDPVITSVSGNSCTLYSMSNPMVEMTVVHVRNY